MTNHIRIFLDLCEDNNTVLGELIFTTPLFHLKSNKN